MSQRWKLGNYQFTVNPNRYGESVEVVGDTVKTLDGTVISQPTELDESYEITSVFFQSRPRIVAELSFPKSQGLKFVNGNYYLLDNTTKKVNKYNKNMSLLSTTNIIDTPNGENLIALDVESDGTIWAVQESVSPSKIHKVVNTTKTIYSMPVQVQGTVEGICVDSSFIYIVTDLRKLYKISKSNMTSVSSVSLPFISYNNLGYQGMSIIKGYLVMSFNDGEQSGAYHMDINDGRVVSRFSIPNTTYTELIDVTHDGTNFVFLCNGGTNVKYSNGNTLLVDIYELENQIQNYGYLNLVDDMGVSRRVTVTNYGFEREDNSLTKYQVNLSIKKVGRGVN
jgi:hypothetical protein